MFGLAHPVMSAPMALHSGGTLAAAVSAAGGLGCFGGTHPWIGPDWIRAEIATIRATTDRPFAVGFITPFLPFTEPLFDATLEARPEVVALSFADPQPWLTRAKDAGARVMCQVQNYEDAAAAVAAGADVLVAPPVRTGAWLGTAFLATPEAVEVHDIHKRLIVESDGGDTVWTRTYDIVSGLPWPTGIGERVRRNRFTDEWSERESTLRDRAEEFRPAEGANPFGAPPDPDTSEIIYGQSASFVDGVRPAADVVRTISDEAEAILDSRPRSLIQPDRNERA